MLQRCMHPSCQLQRPVHNQGVSSLSSLTDCFHPASILCKHTCRCTYFRAHILLMQSPAVQTAAASCFYITACTLAVTPSPQMCAGIPRISVTCVDRGCGAWCTDHRAKADGSWMQRAASPLTCKVMLVQWAAEEQQGCTQISLHAQWPVSQGTHIH